jgi:hypothetical protein
MKTHFRKIKKVLKNPNRHSPNKAIIKETKSKLDKLTLNFNGIRYAAYIEPATDTLVIPPALSKYLNSIEINTLVINENVFELIRDKFNRVQSYKKIFSPKNK